MAKSENHRKPQVKIGLNSGIHCKKDSVCNTYKGRSFINHYLKMKQPFSLFFLYLQASWVFPFPFLSTVCIKQFWQVWLARCIWRRDPYVTDVLNIIYFNWALFLSAIASLSLPLPLVTLSLSLSLWALLASPLSLSQPCDCNHLIHQDRPTEGSASG